MKYFSFIFVLSFISNFTFSSETQINRFETQFEVLDQSINSGKRYKKIALDLTQGGARVAAFNLQALGKVYQGENEKFQKIRKDFKKLEDRIGNYGKWDDIYKEAKRKNLSTRKQKQLKKKRDEVRGALAKLLKEEKWAGRRGKLNSYKKFVRNYEWPSELNDRKIVSTVLVNQIERVINTDYDMYRLEKDGPGENRNGVHELRRELRWFLIMARVVDGLVQFKDSNYCPVSSLEALPQSDLATSKYGILNTNDELSKVCYMSQCLFLGVVQKVSQVGKIKDLIETELNLRNTVSDITPDEFIPKLKKLKSEIYQSMMLEEISAELKQCL